ncbi:MAG: Cof-type HAD-IIB family hydrolase [Propionibacteriaceae bacterium]|nr:Cof-type HAD-IIB family hydrolase [Propionibacteriaceae bacterium]
MTPVQGHDQASDLTLWRPKLVAVDADGTIVEAGDHVPDGIAAALRDVDAAGVPVVLATGRSWLAARIILEKMGITDMYCVCSNGATVISYPDENVVGQVTFDPAPLVEALRDHPTVVVAVEDFGHGYNLSAPFPPGGFELRGELRVVGWDELAQQEVLRMIVRDPFVTPADFDAMMSQLDLSQLYWCSMGENWIEIGGQAAGKSRGLELVADRLGVDQTDVLALGDGNNDIDMVSWAGRGVALADAPPELKAVADAVTGSFASGGTVEELRRWFPVL